jgi:spore maturation protein CgeB
VPIRVLYVGMEYDYGDPTRGLSFEQVNFYDSFVSMGCEVTQFDFMATKRARGLDVMRTELVETVRRTDPELIFLFLFEWEIDARTIERMRAVSSAPIVNWFADDHWRFESFSSRLAPHLDLCITTDEDSIQRYHDCGISHVLLSQWACNHRLYRPADGPLEHSVSFVGQPHSNRRQMVDRLRHDGIDVDCWGHGWPAGRISQENMIRVFGTSGINLNPANSSKAALRSRVLRRVLLKPPLPERPHQIKGRTFEIPGCRGFQITNAVPHLDRYFEPGKEIATYDGTYDDLLKQIQYWLENPERRRTVAEASYERVLREHTYEHRFHAIFDQLGLG